MIGNEGRDTAFFMRHVLCLSSPVRGDFTAGGGVDSKVGSTSASSLKVTVCCFGGVPTNPAPLSVDTKRITFLFVHQLSNYYIHTCTTNKCCLKVAATRHTDGLCYSASLYSHLLSEIK